MKVGIMSRLMSAFAALLAFASFAAPEIVSKDIGDPEMNGWKPGDWVTAAGKIIALDERPDDPDAPKGAKALRFETAYPGQFGGWMAHPTDGGLLPGKPVKFTGWARKGNKWGTYMAFSFEDANTNSFEIAWKKPASELPEDKKNLPFDRRPGVDLTEQWQKFEMVVPSEVNHKFKDKDGKEKTEKMPIRFPIKLVSASQNNWYDKGNRATRWIDIYDFRLHTDMEGIPVADRPFSLRLTYPATGNVFYSKEQKPEITVSVNSWLGEERTIKFDATAVSAYGEERKIVLPDFKVLDGASASWPLPFDEPGAYKVTVKVSGTPKELTLKSRYAVALRPRELNDEEKEASTYGINVHGGGFVGYENFSRLGFIWVRDYAYNFHWMNNARGDGKYAGWPWYPKILKGAEDQGMKTLPCLMGGVTMKASVKNDPSWWPSADWRRQMAQIVSAFPTITAWELDNETDGTVWTDLDAYGRYCQAFGDICAATRPDAKAVSPGLASIYVEFTQKLVEKGYFRNISVVNGHRYCGQDAPEYAKQNLNTGASEAKPAYLRDLWRHWKKAATCDGKFRELWVTEWGWDTLAGQPVSEIEQAAYMQRKWVLAMGNGVEKMFWYWYYDDNTDTPNYFFAGCGIYDRYHEPKPSAPAFACMRTFIPGKYEYLGTANFGPNHMAQIVKADGKIVALAYKIRKDGSDLEIKDEKAERITDMFGKVQKRGTRKLGIDPTWYVGLDPNSDWLKQCPMDLNSDFYVRNVGGEPIRIEVTGPDKYEYSVNPPKGWTVEKRPYGFDVTGPAGLERGNTTFTVTGKNGKIAKTMTIDVDIVPQAFAKSGATAFDGAFKLDVTNQSSTDQVFVVKAELPQGWSVEPAEVKTAVLAPEERTTLDFKLASHKPVDPSATGAANPKLAVLNSTGMQVDYAPIIPRQWTMHRIDGSKIRLDGDLSDWTDRNRVNSFMIGPSGDKDPSKFYFGYAKAGLYVALDIDDSKCFTADPGSFWRAADCLEIQMTTPGGVAFKEDAPWTVFDHQFWFCPLADEKRVFAGFWGNCDGQKVEGDLKDVKTGLVKTARGYRAEIFIPAARFKDWEAMKPGAEIGLSFTLVVQGFVKEHELYWPSSKREKTMKQPWKWAKVKLVD